MRGKCEIEVHLKRSLWKCNLRHFEVFDEDYQDFLCKLGIQPEGGDCWDITYLDGILS